MKKYMIYLERKDRRSMYKYFRLECRAANFYEAVEMAAAKTEELKLQIDINYEIIKIEKL